MKQIIKIIIVIFSISCNTKQKVDNNKIQENKVISNAIKIDSTKDFSKIVFASKRDTTCGMPITAGIEDTLVFKGKVYGFCAKGCKDDFIEILKKQHKR